MKKESWRAMEIFTGVALLATACLCAVAQGEYVAIKQCSQAENCLYTYSADQVSSMSGSKSQFFLSSNVEVFCDSVGKYNSKEAKKYCVHVKETSLSTEERTLTEVSSDVEKLLNGPFCFVQTEDGKIASVYHSPQETAQIVNFKKGIAAAFQANFKNTHVEVEEDTLSKHYSRYSYEKIAPGHVIMHRAVDSDSVIQFASSSLNGQPVKIKKSEDVEYKDGKLMSSTGVAELNANGPVESNDYSRFQSNVESAMVENNINTFDPTFGEGGLRGSGKYSLQLQSCSKPSKWLRRRSAELHSYLVASKLHAIAQRDAGEADKDELSRLRKLVPSVRKALDALKASKNNSATISAVKKLLILEEANGPLPGYQPAVAEVVQYLNSEKDFEMRALLFSLLAAEGSLKSQEILLHALITTTDRKERNTLCVQLAFVRNVRPSIVDQIEALIASSNDTTDPLVLAYGALAASSPQLQSRIVQFLQDRVDKARDNVSALIHLVHSLGNTESSSVENILLQLIAHEHSGVRLASVYALRYSVESKDVQDAFVRGLRNNVDPDFVEMVARALIAGTERKQHSEAVPVGDATFQAIMQHAGNNSDLHSMMSYYVVLLGQKSPKEYKDMLRSSVQRRGTTWNDKSDPLYDLVLDYNTRNSDITNYPLNRAYIWSKSLGVTDIKLDLAFGAFAGLGGSSNPTSFKVFGKGIGRGYAFGRTATAFEALIMSENKPGGTTIVNKLYVSIVGKVLVDYTKEIPNCKTWTYPIYNSPEYTLLTFRYSIFIYVGTVDFTISLSTKFGVSASLTACLNKCASATAALTPQVTLTATAGASVTLIEAVRGGIDIAASFQYQLQPQVTASYLLGSKQAEFCLSLMHGWPNNKLSIYPYYHLRSVTFCKGWKDIPYPCGFGWGDKRKWEAATKEWQLPGSSSLSPIWSSCDPTKLQCPLAN